MMVEREDLGLSLSLNFPQTHNNHSNTTTTSSSFRLNLMPSLLPTSASSTSGFPPQKPLWNDSLPSSDLNSNSETYRAGPRSFLRGIDVNRLPSTVDCEDEAGVSSPNSTVSSVSGKRSERDANGEDLDLERDGSRGISDEEDGEACRKKLRLSKDQSAILEESFKEHNTLNPVSVTCLPRQSLRLVLFGCRENRQISVWLLRKSTDTYGFICFGCRSKNWRWPNSLGFGLDKWKSGFRTEEQEQS
ncbi:unnamed protein product [Malus baccata var. baccata]